MFETPILQTPEAKAAAQMLLVASLIIAMRSNQLEAEVAQSEDIDYALAA